MKMMTCWPSQERSSDFQESCHYPIHTMLSLTRRNWQILALPESVLQFFISLVCSQFGPPLKLSFKETGSPHVKDYKSVEEVDNEKGHVPIQICSFPSPGGCFDVVTSFCEVSHNKRETLIRLHQSSALPVQEIQEAIAELEEAVSFSLEGQETKKKRRRRKRRLAVKKCRLFQKSEPRPLTVITSILKKAFFQFLKAGLRKMCILLVFTSCFPGTYGFETCEKTFPIATDELILLRDSNMSLLCTVDKVSSCPQMTNCTGNLEFCAVNNSAIKISYSREEFGTYFVESKAHERILLDIKGCRENDAKNPPEFKPEVNNGWTLQILVLVLVTVCLVSIVVIGVVVWKRRWCRPSEKNSSKRPSTSLTVDSVAYENSSNNTSLDQLESFIKATGDQPDASSLSV